MRAADAIDSVVTGNALVEHGEIRIDDLGDAKILVNQLSDETVSFPQHSVL